MNQTISLSSGLLVLVTMLGCTSVSNMIITPHPMSLRGGELSVDVDCSVGAEGFGAALAPVAGLVVAGVKKLVEEEAKQYETSYSAVRHFEWDTPLCRLDGRRGDWLTMSGRLVVSQNGTAARLSQVRVVPLGVKSKVAGLASPASIWGSAELTVAEKVNAQAGYLWPWMWLHAFYGRVINSDVFETDLSVRVRIDAVVEDKKKRTSEKLAELDLKVGKFDVTSDAKVKDLESGWFPLPNTTSLPVPTTITLTIMEANDLGDTIGKGAKLIGEKEEDLGDRLEGFFSD